MYRESQCNREMRVRVAIVKHLNETRSKKTLVVSFVQGLAG